MQKLKLGEILVEENLITPAQLSEALEKQKVIRKKLGQILIDMKAISESEMLTVLAKKLGFDYTENPMSLVDMSIRDLVPQDFAQQNSVLPLFLENGTLYVATSEPLDFIMLEDLSMITGLDTYLLVSPNGKIKQGISSMYTYSNTDDDDIEQKVDQEDIDLMDRVDSAPIVKLVNTMIANAFSSNASDIHIEPEEARSRVRYRVDGVLSEQMVIKKEHHDLVTTRIKIIAGMNIAEKRIPQDGSFRQSNELFEVDIRVSSIPTPLGEKLVLRLLGSDRNINYDLSQIDIADDIKDELRAIAKVPNGILLLTGPTGSGKTTTLYSLLNEVSSVEQSVVTIEDPVEKQFDGITQVQINNKAGLTFASGLRSILRQDPDVIMVGEIRDSETASIAIRAAITGHFVLSTLHTNDALSSIVRLTDMGVEPYLVASSLKAVIAQRLVRKVCPHCGEKEHVSQEDQILFGDPDLTEVMKGGGCERCNHTGYIGRTAVFEIIFVDENLQQMIADRASMKNLREYAISKNTRFLKDDVIRLMKSGITTVHEARRILFSIN